MALIEHLEKLRHFYKVTTYSSINEAAKATGMSQAGLSKSIANLEHELETTLFRRTKNGLDLTKEGELLLETSKEIIKLANLTEFKIRSLHASHVPDKIKLGMYDSIAVYFFPELKTYLKAIYPNVEIELVVEKSTSLAEKVRSGKIDIAFGVNFDNSKEQNTVFTNLFEDHYSYFVKSGSLPIENTMPLIYHPDATDILGKSIETHIATLSKNRELYKVMNFETVKSLTLSGLGIGILPTLVAKPLIQSKDLKQVHVGKSSQLFGRHTIGLLSTSKIQRTHQDFVKDILRLGERWVKA